MTPTIQDILAGVTALEAKSAALVTLAGEAAAKATALAAAQADSAAADAARDAAGVDVEQARIDLIEAVRAFLPVPPGPPAVTFAAKPGAVADAVPVGKIGDGELLRKILPWLKVLLPLILDDGKKAA